MIKSINLIPSAIILASLVMALNFAGGTVDYIGDYYQFDSHSVSLNKNDLLFINAQSTDGADFKIKLKLYDKYIYDYEDKIVYNKGGKGTFTVDKYASDVWYDEINITVWKDSGLTDIDGIALVDWFREPFRNPDADFKISGMK